MSKTNGMRNTWLISAGFFFAFFGFSSSQQYLTIVLEKVDDRGAALILLFLLYGAFLIGSIFVAKSIKLLGGLKRAAVIGAVTYALFPLSVAVGIQTMYAGALVVGFGASLLWVSSAKMIADSSPQRMLARNLALVVVAQNLGSIAGLYCTNPLLNHESIAHLYGLLGICAAVSVPFFMFVRTVDNGPIERPFNLFFAFDSRMVCLFPLVFGALFLSAESFTAMNSVIAGAIGIGSIALIIGMFKAANAAGSISVGSIADRLRKTPVLYALSVLVLVGIALFVGGETLPRLILGALIIGFSAAAVTPVVLAWMKERLEEGEYLQGIGVFYVYSNVGALCAITLNARFSPVATFIPVSAILLLSFPGIALFNMLTKK